MEIGFGEALLLIGSLLAVSAALSGLFSGTVLSISVLSVAAGAALAFADVIAIEPGSEALVKVIELALIFTLFADGLVVERELLWLHWRPPARALIGAFPITLGLIALIAHLLFPQLSWAEAALVGAVLAPTDPVVTSTVVTSTRVPAVVRHTLNLESGLNDGLALPVVLFFLVLVQPGGEAASQGVELLGEAAVGAAIGAGLAAGAGWLLPRLPGAGLTHRYEGVYALGLGLAAFGLADVTWGNGLIAAFVAGIVLAVTVHEMPDAFSEFNEGVSAVFQVVTFVLFGALVVAIGFRPDLLALAAVAAATLLVARPLAIFAAFTRTSLPFEQKAFIAWFGPKGVASMLFALFVLNSAASDRTLVFDIVSFVILTSILAHGLTDTLGARWIESRLAGGGEPDAQAEPTRAQEA